MTIAINLCNYKKITQFTLNLSLNAVIRPQWHSHNNAKGTKNPAGKSVGVSSPTYRYDTTLSFRSSSFSPLNNPKNVLSSSPTGGERQNSLRTPTPFSQSYLTRKTTATSALLHIKKSFLTSPFFIIFLEIARPSRHTYTAKHNAKGRES